jgi:3'-phosphoadenosine 5'-phosphosulfate (PAPS) 3'-phosphatase
MCVVEGWADAYLMSNPSTYKWDTCAPHAILRALGVQFASDLRLGFPGPVSLRPVYVSAQGT